MLLCHFIENKLEFISQYLEQDVPLNNVTLAQDDGEISTTTYLSTGGKTSRESLFLKLWTLQVWQSVRFKIPVFRNYSPPSKTRTTLNNAGLPNIYHYLKICIFDSSVIISQMQLASNKMKCIKISGYISKIRLN